MGILMREDAIAVTAYGAVTALGVGVDALWHGVLEGRRPFAKTRAFGVEGCRAQLAAEVTVPVPEIGADRSAGLAVLAATEALAAHTAEPARQRIGLVVGSAGAGAPILERRLQDPAGTSADWWQRMQKRWLADVIAPELGLHGPTAVVNTACSSATVAIALGCDWLRAGDCDVVLAIGTDELARFTYTGFNALRALDREACRPFDKSRHGMSMGEGAGCLVLEPARTALRRDAPIRGYIVGVGLACDAYHLTAPDPEGHGAARALTQALRAARLEPDAVGFVNAHGTGTPLNDAAEVAALQLALGVAHARNCPVHSVKATTGHCMGAAGAIEAIVALQSLTSGLVPATAGLLDSDFEGRVNCVQGGPLSVTAEYAVSTNFGFGGNDAALVLAHAHA
jgi:3-oxoacyl-[acyl-carrier-protein] synthase II